MADTSIKLSGTYDSIEAYNILEEMREMSTDYEEIKEEAEAAASAATAAITTAQTAANNASTSANNAQTYAGNANTSAGEAAGYASNASTSATNAAASETNASNSATVAAGSASAAADSADEAEAAAAEAAATLQNYLPLSGGSVTGNIDITGDLSVTGAITGDLTGNADTATNATNATNDGNGDQIDTTYMPIAGGTFTGDVNGVTPSVGDNSTKMSTTAYVQTEISAVNTRLGTILEASGTSTTKNAYVTLCSISTHPAGTWLIVSFMDLSYTASAIYNHGISLANHNGINTRNQSSGGGGNSAVLLTQLDENETVSTSGYQTQAGTMRGRLMMVRLA